MAVTVLVRPVRRRVATRAQQPRPRPSTSSSPRATPRTTSSPPPRLQLPTVRPPLPAAPPVATTVPPQVCITLVVAEVCARARTSLTYTPFPPPPFPSAAAPAAGVAAYYPQQGAAAGGYGAGAGAGGAGGGGGGNAQGPANANLFIYHMPPDFTDQDLQATFAPYGALLSVKVFRDKNTGESKCFGFASYADPTSAQAAIQALNGFQVRGKRLRVELKRPRGATAGAPY